MSEHDDEIRAKCRWLIEQKHITLPVETGVLVGEIFDVFKEIESLKAQLKEAEFIAELGNCISEQGRAYAKEKNIPFENCAEAVLIERWERYSKAVKARSL